MDIGAALHEYDEKQSKLPTTWENKNNILIGGFYFIYRGQINLAKGGFAHYWTNSNGVTLMASIKSEGLHVTISTALSNARWNLIAAVGKEFFGDLPCVAIVSKELVVPQGVTHIHLYQVGKDFLDASA